MPEEAIDLFAVCPTGGWVKSKESSVLTFHLAGSLFPDYRCFSAAFLDYTHRRSDSKPNLSSRSGSDSFAR